MDDRQVYRRDEERCFAAQIKKTCTRGMRCRRFKQTYYEKTFTKLNASASPASYTEVAVGLRFEMAILDYPAGRE
jgi:hypothetical protein